MVSSLQAKVSRLEAAAGGGGECPRCGWGEEGDVNHTYEVTFVEPGGPEDREEFCEACGRQLVYVIGWGGEA